MAHVVVIGASTGGLPAAYDIQQTLGKNHRITVISNSETFQFTPSNPRVAVGRLRREHATFKLEPIRRKNRLSKYISVNPV